MLKNLFSYQTWCYLFKNRVASGRKGGHTGDSLWYACDLPTSTIQHVGSGKMSRRSSPTVGDWVVRVATLWRFFSRRSLPTRKIGSVAYVLNVGGSFNFGAPTDTLLFVWCIYIAQIWTLQNKDTLSSDSAAIAFNHRVLYYQTTRKNMISESLSQLLAFFALFAVGFSYEYECE